MQLPCPGSRSLYPGTESPAHLGSSLGWQRLCLQLGKKKGLRGGFQGRHGGEGALKDTEGLKLEVRAGNRRRVRLVSPEFILGGIARARGNRADCLRQRARKTWGCIP